MGRAFFQVKVCAKRKIPYLSHAVDGHCSLRKFDWCDLSSHWMGKLFEVKGRPKPNIRNKLCERLDPQNHVLWFQRANVCDNIRMFLCTHTANLLDNSSKIWYEAEGTLKNPRTSGSGVTAYNIRAGSISFFHIPAHTNQIPKRGEHRVRNIALFWCYII